MKNFDVVIIGGGIIGSLIARELSRFELSIALLEAASDVGTGASSANSAIIHSGHDPEPGTLKALYNKRGNKLWGMLVRELDIPFRRSGSLVVALTDEERQGLVKLLERARCNGIEGARIIDREECLEKEPMLNSECRAALWTPTAGIIDPFAAVLAVVENAIINGVELFINTRVESLLIKNDTVVGVRTAGSEWCARMVINAAGIHADEILHRSGLYSDFHITPRRGEYFVFDSQSVLLATVLFPMPSEKGKGTLVTTTMHGNTMIGPNALVIEDKSDRATSRKGQEEILRNAKRLVPSLNERDIIASFAGVRATGNHPAHDFFIEKSMPGLVNVAGIDSPGFASSPAIAEKVVAILKESGPTMTKKKIWTARRHAAPVFKKLSFEEKNRLIVENPAYGNIVCRCEGVTEGEVTAAVHGIIPARDYDAVKRRCWLGTGRCQGAFDIPRVLEILSRELGLPMDSLSKKGAGSEWLKRPTKELR